MKLTHPDSKQTVETTEPEAYLSQGWEEKPAPKPAADKKSEQT